jgi:hypothetical protein
MDVKPSRHAEVALDFGGEERRFRLALGQLRELQERVDAGPAHLLQRLTDSTWRVDDIRETLRLGLIGGGMAPSEALALVRRYVDERPLLESVPLARAVLLVVLLPIDGDEPGKPEPAEGASGPTRADGSPSPASMGPAAP